MAYDLNVVSCDMESFCKLFAKQVGGEKPQTNGERLFRCLFREETAEKVTTRHKNMFRHFCKKLMENHQYSVLLDFVRGAMVLHKQYDLAVIYELISDIQIREGYDLAQLCLDYAREVQAGSEFMQQVPEGADLYHDYPEGLLLVESGRLARTGMVRTLMKHVYQLPYEEGKLHKGHIDALVEMVRQEAEEKHREECEWRKERNAEIDALSAKHGHPFHRQPLSVFAAFDRDRAIPGLLVPFLQVAELAGDVELCYYIQSQYAMPALATVPWEQTEEKALPFLARSARYYGDYLLTLFYREFPFVSAAEAEDPEYIRKELYYEAIGKSAISRCRYTGEHMQQYSQRHCELFALWADVLDRGGKLLKTEQNPNTYAFLLLQVPYVLFFGGQAEKAAYFLLRHYGELNSVERSKPHLPILLSRSILGCSGVDAANALYGLFSYELGQVERERMLVRKLSYDMLDFLQDARAYILEANEHTLESEQSWFDILFADGARDTYFRECREILDAGELLPSRRFNTVYQQVRAFSHPTGVMLTWLGMPKYDNYDKLPGALSPQLTHRGQGYWVSADEAKSYNVRAAQMEPLRNIDLHLQNHLFKLQRSGVAEKLSRVRELKQALPQDASQEERDALLAEISAIADDLVALTMGSSMRPEAERKITALRQDFEEKYLDGRTDLMQKLPEKIRADVHNYLVTSTMVYSMMEARDDDTLDYSAALISMTKALELVMLYVYSRLHICQYEGIDADTLKHYFKDGEPIEKPTLRPCIETLKGKRFAAWGGESVLEISMLTMFSDITMHVGEVEDRFSPSKKYANRNRDLLTKALGYICENYRNRSAHPDVVTRMQVKECQQLLIDGQKLLWILLAILKEA